MIEHAEAGITPHLPQVKGRINIIRPRKTPYFGSVRFFKHLIVIVLAIALVAPWGGVIYLSARLRHQETLSAELNGAFQTLTQQIRNMEVAVEEANSLNLLLTEQMAQEPTALNDYHSAYGHLYPELQVDGPTQYVDSTKTIYLTFDDGPGKNTKAVLEILDHYDIKATFFVVGSAIKGREDMLRQIAAAGHTIGVHTYSHVYKEIYASLEAFLGDFAMTSQLIDEITGIKPNIFRFPGGSINSYNEAWGNTIISEMLSRGYRYYDWNVGSNDVAADATADSIYELVLRQARSNDYGVVLLHDGGGSQQRTVSALSRIIVTLQNEGYTFDCLTNQVVPTVFASGSYNRG